MVTGEAVISNALMKDIFMEAATNQPILGGDYREDIYRPVAKGLTDKIIETIKMT